MTVWMFINPTDKWHRACLQIWPRVGSIPLDKSDLEMAAFLFKNLTKRNASWLFTHLTERWHQVYLRIWQKNVSIIAYKSHREMTTTFLLSQRYASCYVKTNGLYFVYNSFRTCICFTKLEMASNYENISVHFHDKEKVLFKNIIIIFFNCIV